MVVLAPDETSSLSSIRPFSITRDLPALADLVEVCFEDELERTNSRIVADMREMAHLGAWLYLLALSGSPYRGLIWEDRGRMLGNVSMARERGRIWSLSNVAVSPESRGRGIAGLLVDAALMELRRLRADRVILQVRPENTVAVGLYERRGFVAVDRVCELALAADVALPMPVERRSDLEIRSPRRSDVPGLLALQFGDLAGIARGTDPLECPARWERSTLRGVWMALKQGLGGLEHTSVVALAGEQPVGVGWLAVRLLGTYHEIGLAVPVGSGAGVGEAVLQAVIARLGAYPQRELRATVSTRHPDALDALHDAGFVVLRTLDRMVLRLD
ncbi:MAG: GNAT family N-acetyltransferase [Chloroflexi bacterium]|nr:GNAT family N-acetyltransferase [Chloroflexota bacterium]